MAQRSSRPVLRVVPEAVAHQGGGEVITVEPDHTGQPQGRIVWMPVRAIRRRVNAALAVGGFVVSGVLLIYPLLERLPRLPH